MKKLIVGGVILVLFAIGLNYYNGKLEESKVKDIKNVEDVQKAKDGDREKAELPKTLTLEEAENEWKAANPKAYAAAQKAEAVKKRVDYVNLTERTMLSEGYDVECSAYGPGKTIYKMKFILMGRPLVYKLTNENNHLETLKAMGFTKAIFTDGYDQTWTYNLK